MCNEQYESKKKGIWKEMCTNDDGDDNKHHVFSYFLKQDLNQKISITSKVHRPKDFDFDITFPAQKAFDMLTDKIFTSKVTKGRRRTQRKAFSDEVMSSQYDWMALIHYLREAYLEGLDEVLLSKKEIAMLAPNKTKKELLTQRVSKNSIGY
ncbi:hypothetical protein VPHG_00187 [Vibrio phage 11895-B1]|uniref:hypothetical protein n=1 Tax=Vibrio phage 11895-B1 TaxID=754075 RepID=UPI0002C10B7E|nr:hypothetical protein VPHG_00187 [Vibrio phage 11895-B1]AGH32250.1 hypothetical protein VPHG_00187 [Vibrio phage 11895-B1]